VLEENLFYLKKGQTQTSAQPAHISPHFESTVNQVQVQAATRVGGMLFFHWSSGNRALGKVQT
jgi:hypothetical protein